MVREIASVECEVNCGLSKLISTVLLCRVPSKRYANEVLYETWLAERFCHLDRKIFYKEFR